MVLGKKSPQKKNPDPTLNPNPKGLGVLGIINGVKSPYKRKKKPKKRKQ